MSEKLKYILTPATEQHLEDILADEKSAEYRDKWLYKNLRTAAVNASKNIMTLETEGKLVFGNDVLIVTKADFDKSTVKRDESYKPDYTGKLNIITIGSHLYKMLLDAATLQRCLNKSTDSPTFKSMEEYIQSLIMSSVREAYTALQEKMLTKEEKDLEALPEEKKEEPSKPDSDNG
tara:strand:- start:1239 stop:1769 length:531 start_codon:yes stop_codon:yes gene_type:complete